MLITLKFWDSKTKSENFLLVWKNSRKSERIFLQNYYYFLKVTENGFFQGEWGMGQGKKIEEEDLYFWNLKMGKNRFAH